MPAGDEMSAGTDAGAQTPMSSDPLYCPPSAPMSHQYETLTICGEVESSAPLVEAVVAQWTADYTDAGAEAPTGSESSAGESSAGEPTISPDPVVDAGAGDDGIGVLIDYGVPEGE